MFLFEKKEGLVPKESDRHLVIHVDDVNDVLAFIKDSDAQCVSVEDPRWANADYARIVKFIDNSMDFARICHKINSSNVRTYPDTIGY